MTLIELLVVGTIILIMTAVSLPMIKPMLESQATKNGAQLVSTYLNRAKVRAVTSGRPCGVRFEHWSGTEGSGSGSAALILRQVDVPPVYSGMTGDETVYLIDLGSDVDSDIRYELFSDDDYLMDQLKKGNGRIQLGVNSSGLPSGAYFRTRFEYDEVLSTAEEDVIHVYVEDNPTCSFSMKSFGETIEDPYDSSSTCQRTGNLSFKAYLPPKVTMAAPEPLPQGTVVDLQFSGGGTGYFENSGDVTVVFAPGGEVDTVNGMYPTASMLHFLVGRWDQISAVRTEYDPETFPNYADGRNFWVSINTQTGLMHTSEVNPNSDLGYAPDDAVMAQSREFANELKRNIGGN